MNTLAQTSANYAGDSQAVKLAFGRVLTTHRERAGFKQRAFSRTVGISNSHLRSIESGEVSPTIATLFKIASTLDEEPATLIAEAADALRHHADIEYSCRHASSMRSDST